MTFEDQLHDSFSMAVADLERPDRWQEVVTRGRRRRRNRRIGAVGSAAIALAAAVGITVALAGGPTTSHVKITPVHRSRTAPPTPPNTIPSSPTTATPQAPAIAPSAGSSPSATVVPARSATTAAPAPPPPAKSSLSATGASAASTFPYVPLYPFATQAQADVWLAASRSSGVQPWHEDPGVTALSFAAFLGYTDINQVTGSNVTATEAHVSVGYLVAASQPHTAAVIHLVRYGPSPDAPWEVVGTDDSPTFTITSPAYAAVVRSPIVAGGRITGVDESITVQVLALSSNIPVGRTCCQPAGGTQSPWTVAAPFTAAPGQVLIVSAATGGHVAAVERFVVTGVRD